MVFHFDFWTIHFYLKPFTLDSNSQKNDIDSDSPNVLANQKVAIDGSVRPTWTYNFVKEPKFMSSP